MCLETKSKFIMVSNCFTLDFYMQFWFEYMCTRAPKVCHFPPIYLIGNKTYFLKVFYWNFWHTFKYFWQLISKIWYFKHNKDILWELYCISFAIYERRKILLWIVGIKPQEQNVGKIFEYDAKKLEKLWIYQSSFFGFWRGYF